MRVVGLIPSRYASVRLPAKALALVAGKPMVQHVYERACGAACLDEVIVATDDERIARAVRGFGGRAELTSRAHPSGTDRIAEVAGNLEADVVVNIQGDEVMIQPDAIEAAVAPFLGPAPPRIGTLATPISAVEDYLEPSVVKVVVDSRGWALYFSRAPIPFFREDATPAEGSEPPWLRCASELRPLKHLGLYVYTREALLWFAGLAPTPLERAERLEQLRALEHGCPIRVVVTDYSPLCVDTPEDLRRVREIMEGGA